MVISLIKLIHAAREKIDYRQEAASIPITSITSDSRQVGKGSLFAAIRGTQSDGTQFIAQAVKAGAAAVLCGSDTKVDAAIIVLRAQNPRKALAEMAAAFYGVQPKHIAAVTGTDGKTSTADFFRQFWHYMGQPAASIGTLGILLGAGETISSGSQTTPGPIQLHEILAELAKQHVEHVGMEASSHGLDQYRLDAVTLEAAAFTNLTRDHLDYHKTEAAYFAAKLRLFAELLPEGKTAVLNQDDGKFAEIKKICDQRRHKVIGFGKRGSEFKLLSITPHAHGQLASLELFGKPYSMEIPLVGGFQVMNILTALGLVIGCGGDMQNALSVVPQFKGVPGRLELVVTLANGASVFIDYAHTPMALANILNTLRPHTKNKLHVVFGCGGDRDAGKRPEMGRIAEQLADQVIVTDDNPRSEDPALIRKAILAAACGATEIGGRKEAIYAALQKLEAGDVLVIAGKGHEKTQTIAGKTYPFDDAEVARQAAKDLRLAA